MTKAEKLIAKQAAKAQASIDFMQRMRVRDRRIAGRNRLKLKKSRRRMSNESKRRNR